MSMIISRQAPRSGGLDRHGVIASGSQQEIGKAVEQVLSEAPDRFILGADCTLPGEIPWDKTRAANEAAHAFKKA
jgi:uroporphyrinogen decarboxylase